MAGILENDRTNSKYPEMVLTEYSMKTTNLFHILYE